MKLSEVAFVVFSHSSCEDIWEAYFGELEKYLPDVFENKYLFVDDKAVLNNVPEDFKVIFYQEEMAYSDRMLFCLEQLKEEVCLFQHEDMILYNDVDSEKLEQYLNILVDDELDAIKLLKGGDFSDIPYRYTETLFRAENWYFAVQPSLWKIETLKEIFESFKGTNIWDLESKVQDFCKEKEYKVLYSYCGEEKRGSLHWDSDVFPYISTAICKGKWNTLEYPQELHDLFLEYGIDRMKRGFVI